MADGFRSPAAAMISRVDVACRPCRPMRSSAASRKRVRASTPSAGDALPEAPKTRRLPVWHHGAVAYGRLTIGSMLEHDGVEDLVVAAFLSQRERFLSTAR